MKSLAASAIAIAIVLTPLPSDGSAPASRPTRCRLTAVVVASGSYESDWGRVHLEQDGTSVVGRYVCCGGGRIAGTLDGNVLRFAWRESHGAGRGVWAVASTGELIGSWGHGDDERNGGAWHLRPQRHASQSHVARRD